jgi:hypothetical protein
VEIHRNAHDQGKELIIMRAQRHERHDGHRGTSAPWLNDAHRRLGTVQKIAKTIPLMNPTQNPARNPIEISLEIQLGD